MLGCFKLINLGNVPKMEKKKKTLFMEFFSNVKLVPRLF